MPAQPKAAKAQDFLGCCAEGICCGIGKPLPPGRGLGYFGEGLPETLGRAEECGPVVDRLVLGETEPPADTVLAALAFALVAKLERPRHSGLRSVCLLLHRHARELYAEVGVAVEASDPDARCTAEAAALSRLLLRQGGRSPLEGVERLVLASDARSLGHLAPAASELLAEHLDLGTPVIRAWRGGAKGTELRFETHALSALCPHPCAYRHVAAAKLTAFAEGFAARCAELPQREQGLCRQAREAAAAAPSPPSGDGSSTPASAPPPSPPLALAAAALLKSGAVVLCGPEEPPLPSAAVRLACELGAASRAGDQPEVLLVCDRWGVLHAPSAQGRSCLVKQGFGDVTVLFHDPESGKLLEVKCAELLGVGGAAAAEAPAEKESAAVGGGGGEAKEVDAKES